VNEKTIEEAVTILRMTFPQLEERFPVYEKLEKKLREAKMVVGKNPEVAARLASRILAEPAAADDPEGYGVMCLIQGMEEVVHPEWQKALIAALDDSREAVSSAAIEKLGPLAGEGNTEAFRAIAAYVGGHDPDGERFGEAAMKFLGALSGNPGQENLPEVASALKQVSASRDESVQSSLRQIRITPKNVPETYVRELLDIIAGDRGDSATPEDVLKYQKTVDELARVAGRDHVALLLPLFSHPYWRVRKHAVMAAAGVAGKITSADAQPLRAAIDKAKNDKDGTVSAMAHNARFAT
jgi:hypothetical protein